LFANGTLTLEAAEIPVAPPGVYTASMQPLPLGVRTGQALIVDVAGVVGNNYVALRDSVVEVQAGGAIGMNFEAVDATVSIAAGSIGNDFDAFGSEVHISGGNVGTGFRAWAGSTIYITGGSVGNSFGAYSDSVVNISGGTIGESFYVADSVANISGGNFSDVSILDGSSGDLAGVVIEGGVHVRAASAQIESVEIRDDLRLVSNSNVALYSGNVHGEIHVESESALTITGGSFGLIDASSGTQTTIVGNDFLVNGVPIEGLDSIGSIVAIDRPSGSVLSGTLVDGTPFALRERFPSGGFILQTSIVPTIASMAIDMPADTLPVNGVREGQILTVAENGYLRPNFTAAFGSHVKIMGGVVDEHFEAVGSHVSINGGQVGNRFTGLYGSEIDMSGGIMGENVDIRFGSRMRITGGTIGRYFRVYEGTADIKGGTIGTDGGIHQAGIVNMFGGTIGARFEAGNQTRFNLHGGSVGSDFRMVGGAIAHVTDGTIGSNINLATGQIILSGGSLGPNIVVNGSLLMSGGSVDGTLKQVGGGVYLFGTEFFLNGSDISNSMDADVPLRITQRNVTLSGTLADGSPFSFDLYSTDQTGRDYFRPGYILEITLVSGIPGDFNDDGIVNAADYTVWRNKVGTSVAVRGKDGDGNYDGEVTQADYYVWRKHFGNVSGGLGAGFDERFPANVPEPGSVVLLVMAVVIGVRFRVSGVRGQVSDGGVASKCLAIERTAPGA
jgi:hypothetical protein